MGKQGKRRTIVVSATPGPSGRPQLTQQTLGPVGQREDEQQAEERRRTQIRDRSRLARESAGPSREESDDDGFGFTEEAQGLGPAAEALKLAEILDGTVALEQSHGGGELEVIVHNIEDEMRSRGRRVDGRTRRDRTHRRNMAFEANMPRLQAAWIRWGVLESKGEEGQAERWTAAPKGTPMTIRVVDISGTYTRTLTLDHSNGTGASLIERGLIPCAPSRVSVVITAQTLEIYRVQHARCPQFALDAFVKSLCDLNKTPYQPYLRTQFSIAYDLYLDLRRRTEKSVLEVLGRNNSIWRLTHACPACMYRLEGEDKLIFELLVTMDGNDSLKRVLRRESSDEDTDKPAPSSERRDDRDASDGLFLSRDAVDRWAKRQLGNLMPTEGDENPCAGRWHNMVEAVTSKMWSVFDETGIFLCLCRHGFALLVVDMVRSGELSKYPLAVTEQLLKHFGCDLVIGYDIGCSFKTTVAQSELGAAAQKLCLRCLVGSFHGHAHNRLCQLRHLATYVKGMGLEDLEGCERCFSRSNGLARSCRYASRFHRQQEISTYFKHNDNFETYGTLSILLCKKYRSALAILATEQQLLRAMFEEGLTDVQDFEQAVQDEEAYLLQLKASSKSKDETADMEYLRKLEKFYNTVQQVKELQRDVAKAQAPDATYNPDLDKLKIRLRHARDREDRDVRAVEDMEAELDIMERWIPESPEWRRTVKAVRSHEYRKAIDGLELLIIQRLLELTKMNRSGIGYKMRKHIAKALQARSKAIRNAIDRYNTAAAAMSPSRDPLTWEQVVEYAFPADFDLLRNDDENSLEDVKWAQPMFRFIMDKFFKLERAREEVQRLNIEIRRVVTWIRDERHLLREKERELREAGDEGLAVQLSIYRQQRGIFDAFHLAKFRELAKLPGFTGTLEPGKAQGFELDVDMGDAMQEEEVEDSPVQEEDMDAAEEDQIHEQVSEIYYHISQLALDTREDVDDD